MQRWKEEPGRRKPRDSRPCSSELQPRGQRKGKVEGYMLGHRVRDMVMEMPSGESITQALKKPKDG